MARVDLTEGVTKQRQYTSNVCTGAHYMGALEATTPVLD